MEDFKIGELSVENGNVKIDLFLEEKLFAEEDIKDLENIANSLQLLLLKIQNKLDA